MPDGQSKALVPFNHGRTGNSFTLFEAIESGNEERIMDILRQMITAARDAEENADSFIHYLREQDIILSVNTQLWIRQQFDSLYAAIIDN